MSWVALARQPAIRGEKLREARSFEKVLPAKRDDIGAERTKVSSAFETPAYCVQWMHRRRRSTLAQNIMFCVVISLICTANASSKHTIYHKSRTCSHVGAVEKVKKRLVNTKRPHSRGISGASKFLSYFEPPGAVGGMMGRDASTSVVAFRFL